MQFCQIQSEQGRHIPTFFSAWYLVCCILEFVLDNVNCQQPYLRNTFNSWSSKEFHAYTELWATPFEQRKNLMDEISCRTYKKIMSVKHHEICRPKISTHLPAHEKRCSAAKQCTYKCFQNTRLITKILWIWALQ